MLNRILLSLLICNILFSTAQAEDQKVHVASSMVISSAGIFIAKEKGYFKNFGIDADIQLFRKAPEMIVLLAKGDIDVGASNLSAGIYNAMAENTGVKIVADKGHVSKGHDYISLVVRKDHVDGGHYKSFKDLKGFKVAFNSLDGVSQQIVMERFLKKGGLTLKDVELVKLGYAEMNVALKNKLIDATIQLEPFTAQAILDKSAVRIAGSSTVYDEQESAAILFSGKFMKDSEIAAKFLAAYIQGVRDFNNAFDKGEDRKAIIEILKKYTEVTSDEVWAEAQPVALYSDAHVNIKSIKQDLDWYYKNKFLKKAISANDVVDQKILKKALQLIENGKK